MKHICITLPQWIDIDVFFCSEPNCQNYLSYNRITNVDGLVQDCSISIAYALEILQSCTKPSMCYMSWFLTLTYIWKVIWPWLCYQTCKNSPLCPVCSVTCTALNIIFSYLVQMNISRCVMCDDFYHDPLYLECHLTRSLLQKLL